ncbi:MAG: 2-amino-4-hydroxy-6-hydroxymethyldihydropteridine diphosphokinase [Candidatus Omnitrophica bacterium]|nr:2-amino-4-hydroxy-6-hydroxymethyldihydropteridine diphosphokinase [Candidatus Omnitrophota bacterium]
MAKVFIALGTNLGDRKKNIQEALSGLEKIEGLVVDKVSDFIETEPVDCPGSNFLNGVIKVTTFLSPKKILEELFGIEQSLGRKREFKNAPRTIDLDILLYDDKIINEPYLKVPHPLMMQRKFVMSPLLEIEPEIIELVEFLFRSK